MSDKLPSQPGFGDLALIEPVLAVLDDVGYKTPSPIQAEMIPYVLAGRDVMGQAQTGTGKTAAFALPLLSRIALKRPEPQVLVLTPTRELAIQVTEFFERYAAYLKGFRVVPIYGGQGYRDQLRQLKRGVHVVVGTPGRVMDHMRRGTLNLEALICLVLDEADEMLRMGFIDDVEWVLEQTPPGRQIALFSATIPKAIRRIAQQHLQNPQEITIKTRTTTVEATRQRFWLVSGLKKLDALIRILEGESFDGMLVFVRTKTETAELSEKLYARGYASAPLNSDISQDRRERTVERLKTGKLDILVATDVAARGLDLDRISHVINYDIPNDTESYVHRIGRTGRAGRSGEAILFVRPDERRMLRAIERATKQRIEPIELPSTEAINNRRIALFKERITSTLAVEELGFFHQLIAQYQQEYNVPASDIAAALARMVQGNKPLLLSSKPESKTRPVEFEAKPRKKTFSKPEKVALALEEGVERFRIEVGLADGVKPGNIVGAIANEAGLDSAHIGKIDIYDDFSTVDLPEGIPRDIFRMLKKVWVAGQQLRISRLDEAHEPRGSKRKGESKPKKGRANRSKKRVNR